jgi:hypothetical protein
MNLIKYLIPLVLLACKAKVHHEQQKCIDTVVFNCAKDTSDYHWSDDFTDNQLRELARTNKLIIK